MTVSLYFNTCPVRYKEPVMSNGKFLSALCSAFSKFSHPKKALYLIFSTDLSEFL